MNKLQPMSGYSKLVHSQSLRKRSQKQQRKKAQRNPRDSEINNRMMELMATMEDITIGVKEVVTQTAAAQTHPSPIPVAETALTENSTSAVPPPSANHLQESSSAHWKIGPATKADTIR